ncbi:cytochrome ubiquinol oxidase subunit I [Paraburkholderia sp. EG287B]|uniref:cytochrome ubiquinol oxidase subunit I n=1 Tax=Paraburkholderia sp. EG287B TaxID=3237010 RepID=UPI0034D15FC2
MEASALLLSRIQFAATVSFHIIFPSFTIGLAARLAVLEPMALATANRVYREVFGFWLKIFGVAVGMGGVSGIVTAFQFETNGSELSRASGPIPGPLSSDSTDRCAHDLARTVSRSTCRQQGNQHEELAFIVRMRNCLCIRRVGQHRAGSAGAGC